MSIPQAASFDPRKMTPYARKLALECRRCGHQGKYAVGVVLYDPGDPSAPESPGLEEQISFSGHFRCKKCQSAGKWTFPMSTRSWLMIAVAARLVGGKGMTGVQWGRMQLFDGTISRDAASSEDYLRGLIARSPDDGFLHNRLGNLLVKVEHYEQARAAYERAVELNPRDVDSLHELGCLHQETKNPEEATRYFQEVLRLVAHVRDIEPDLLRLIVRDALERLFDLHDPKEGLDFVPWPIPDEPHQAMPSGRDLHLLELDFSQEKAWEIMTDLFIDGNLKRHLRPEPGSGPHRSHRSSRPSAVAAGGRVGRDRIVPRNRPCPCGSGRKYKNCCGVD